jgi:uncharacterized protein YecT (DUF1311 family)
MTRLLLATLSLALALSSQARADEFDPTPQDRKVIADCLESTEGQPELKRMGACIGLVADPCPNEAGATTVSIVACNMREQKIWDGWLNNWYLEAQAELRSNLGASAALKTAQRDWIGFRDAKCGFEASLYEGGTFASVAAGNCMRITTGMRAFEMRAVADDLEH